MEITKQNSVSKTLASREQTLRGMCTTIDTGQVKTKLNTVESAPNSKCGGSIIYAKTDKKANSNRSQGISVVESEEDGDEKKKGN